MSNIYHQYGVNTPEEQQEIVDRANDPAENMLEYWHTFLLVTDHIPNKIIEAQALDKSTKDYTDVLNLRQHARDMINKLNK